MENLPQTIIEKLNTTPAQAAPDTGNPGTTPETENPGKAPDHSKAFAELARKQKAMLERDKKIKEMEAKYGKYDQALSTAKDNPMAILEAAGISLDDLINHQLKTNKVPTPEDKISTVEEKLAALQKEREDEKRALKAEAEAAESQKKQEHFNSEVTAFKNTIKTSIESDIDKYESIHLNDAQELVFETAIEAIKQNPKAYETRQDVETKLLPKILELIEAELFEQDKKKFESSKRLKTPKEPTSTSEALLKEIVTAKEPQKPSVTLTSKVTPTTSQVKSERLLPRDEALRQIAAKYKGLK
jgi:hypothetical protein